MYCKIGNSSTAQHVALPKAVSNIQTCLGGNALLTKIEHSLRAILKLSTPF